MMLAFIVALVLAIIVLADIVSVSSFAWTRCYPGTVRQALYYRWFDLHVLPQFAASGEPSLLRISCRWRRGARSISLSFGRLSIVVGAA